MLSCSYQNFSSLVLSFQLRQFLDTIATQLKNLPSRMKQYAAFEYVLKVVKSYQKVMSLNVFLLSFVIVRCRLQASVLVNPLPAQSVPHAKILMILMIYEKKKYLKWQKVSECNIRHLSFSRQHFVSLNNLMKAY